MVLDWITLVCWYANKRKFQKKICQNLNWRHRCKFCCALPDKRVIYELWTTRVLLCVSLLKMRGKSMTLSDHLWLSNDGRIRCQTHRQSTIFVLGKLELLAPIPINIWMRCCTLDRYLTGDTMLGTFTCCVRNVNNVS